MIIFAWLIFSIIVGAMGSGRNIGFFGAFICSLLLSPIVGLIIVALSKDKQTDASEKAILQQSRNDNTVFQSAAERQSTPGEKRAYYIIVASMVLVVWLLFKFS